MIRSILSKVSKFSPVVQTPRNCFESHKRSMTSIIDEPEYMVSVDESLKDLSQVNVPYLKDVTRQEMYRLHCEDPEHWSVSNLSQKFHTSTARTEAVLFLMQRRQELMQEEASKIASIAEPEKCQAIYRDFVAKRTEAAAINKTNDVKTAKTDRENIINTIGNDNSMSPDNVDTIVAYMDNHTNQLQNLADNEMHMEALVGRLKEMGVPNADVFSETPTESPAKRNLNDDYFPELFGDEEFAAQQKSLLERIAAETKGRRVKDLDFYLSTATRYDGSAIDGTPPGRLDAPHASKPAEAEKPGRWKFAYKDLSKSSVLGDDDNGKRNKRTVICTRQGGLRFATPLEEAKRSWTRNPTQMDMINHKEQIAKFINVDGDDHLTKQLANNKLERRKKLIQERSERS